MNTTRHPATRIATVIALAALATACTYGRVIPGDVPGNQAKRDEWECQREGYQTAAAAFGQDGAVLYGESYKRECLLARGWRWAQD